MIVFSHAIPYGNTSAAGAIDLNIATDNVPLIITRYIHNLGQIGNDIFLVCSAWFLMDSTNFKIKKVFALIGDCVVISIIGLTVFTLLGYHLPIMFIIKQFFPVTFGNYWYLTCYLLLYAIHPLLNSAIKSSNQKTLLAYCVSFFILYSCMGFVYSNHLFFFSELIGFIVIYFFTAYIKLYLSTVAEKLKNNIIGLFIGIIGWGLSSIFITVLGLNSELFVDKMMVLNSFMNPCFLMIAFSLLGLAQTKICNNKLVNYCSGLSLLIYIIHNNSIASAYVKYDVFSYIKENFTYEYLLLWIIIIAFVSLIGSTILAMAYQGTISKYVH